MASGKIGIIGSGIAGCSMAYQAMTQSGKPAESVVFERAPEIGGRIKSISVGGQSINAGGKYIRSSNESVLELAKTLELKLVSPPKPKRGHIIRAAVCKVLEFFVSVYPSILRSTGR